MKLNTKQWVKISTNQEHKTIRFTKQIFKTKSEGESTLGTAKNFRIVNQKTIDKMITDGWKIVDVNAQSKQVDLTGDPATEEAIRQYYIKKKSKQAIQWTKPSVVQDSYKLSTIDHSKLINKLGRDKLESIKTSQDASFIKHHKREQNVVKSVEVECNVQ